MRRCEGIVATPCFIKETGEYIAPEALRGLHRKKVPILISHMGLDRENLDFNNIPLWSRIGEGRVFWKEDKQHLTFRGILTNDIAIKFIEDNWIRQYIGMSMGFTAKSRNRGQTADGVWHIIYAEMELYEITITPNPAGQGTIFKFVN